MRTINPGRPIAVKQFYWEGAVVVCSNCDYSGELTADDKGKVDHRKGYGKNQYTIKCPNPGCMNLAVHNVVQEGETEESNWLRFDDNRHVYRKCLACGHEPAGGMVAYRNGAFEGFEGAKCPQCFEVLLTWEKPRNPNHCQMPHHHYPCDCGGALGDR